MNSPKYLIFADILGFQDLPKKVQCVKSEFVRKCLIRFFREKIELLEGEKWASVIKLGTDDCLLVCDLVDDTLRCLSRLLQISTPFDDIENIPMEIGIGMVTNVGERNGDARDLICKDSVITQLKSGIMNKYHKWYKLQNGTSPCSSYVVLSKEVRDLLEPLDKDKCESFTTEETSGDTTSCFFIQPDVVIRRGSILSFLDHPEIQGAGIYKRIDEVFVPPLEYDEIKTVLQEVRVLLLTGPPEFGKTFTAIRLLWEYFRRGYDVSWVRGAEFPERIEGRRRLGNFELNKGSKSIIYFEDPFGITKYEKNKELERNLALYLAQIKQTDNTYIIISSREEIFKQATREAVGADELKKFNKRMSFKRPTYDYKKRVQILENWASEQGCLWLQDQALKQYIVDHLKDPTILPTPLSISSFARISREITDRDDLKEKLVKESRKTHENFAKEIEAMSDDKALFLSFLFISNSFKVDFVRQMYDELTRELGIAGSESFDRLLAWFKDDRVNLKRDQLTFAHPSYSEALRHLLVDEGGITSFNERIFSKVLHQLSNELSNFPEITRIILKYYKGLPSETRKILVQNLTGYIRSKADGARDLSETEKLITLEHVIVYGAPLVPDTSIRLLNAFIDAGSGTSDQSMNGLDFQLTTDHYGPVIEALGRVTSVRRDLIKIIERMDQEVPTGIYYNYKPEDLIRHLFSPLRYKPEEIQNNLEIIDCWLEDVKPTRIRFLAAIHSEILRGSHYYHGPYPGGVSYGEVALKKTPEMILLRKEAVYLLKRMLFHEDLEVQLAGIQVVGGIGEVHLKGERDLPLHNVITREIEEVIESIEKLIFPTTDHHLLSSIENCLLRWWGQQTPGTSRAGEILRGFPRSLEYKVLKHFIAPDFVIEDFKKIEEEAPVEDRWHWFVRTHLGMRTFSQPEDFSGLSHLLAKKYGTAEKIIRYLNALDEKITQEQSHGHVPIVTCWAKLASSEFRRIKDTPALWSRIPDRFEQEIVLTLAETKKEDIYELAREVLASPSQAPPSKIKTLLKMIVKAKLPLATRLDWTSQLIEEKNTRKLTVFYLPYIFDTKDETSLILQSLKSIIVQEPQLSSKLVRDINFVIQFISGNLSKIDARFLDEFRATLLEKLRDVPKIDHVADELLSFASRSLDSIIDFLNYRFEKMVLIGKGTIEDDEFDVVPISPLRSIANQIRSYEEFERFMEQVCIWYEWEVPLKTIYIGHLMQPVKDLRGEDGGSSYLETYITSTLQVNKVKEAMTAMRYLDLEEGVVGLFLTVGEKGLDAGLAHEVRDLFVDKIDSPRWSILIPGEASPHLTEMKDFLRKMTEKTADGPIKEVLKEIISLTDDFIKEESTRWDW